MKTRSYDKELLDEEIIPQEDLYQNLKELAFINTYLGGHEVIKKGLAQFLGFMSVLEIGSGGGDNLMALKKRYPSVQYTGLDMKHECITYAQKKDAEIDWIELAYENYTPTVAPDIIFNSLFCHHFTDEQLIKMLQWMEKNAKMGFVIGDLHRHFLAYWSIKILTAIFSSSYLVKNDAPLSVQRGFKRKEWETLLLKAGIEKYEIRWCWAFRHLIVVKF